MDKPENLLDLESEIALELAYDDDAPDLAGVSKEIAIIALSETTRLAEALRESEGIRRVTDWDLRYHIDRAIEKSYTYQPEDELDHFPQDYVERLRTNTQISDLAANLRREINRLARPRRILAILLSGLAVGIGFDSLYFSESLMSAESPPTYQAGEMYKSEVVDPNDIVIASAAGLLIGTVVGGIGYKRSDQPLRDAKRRALKEVGKPSSK